MEVKQTLIYFLNTKIYEILKITKMKCVINTQTTKNYKSNL